MNSNLEVWKLSHQLTLEVYKISKSFPKSEQFGLVSQVRRSASSVPTNIVEGQARQYKKEFIQFLYIAKASLEETNYHLFFNQKYWKNYDILIIDPYLANIAETGWLFEKDDQLLFKNKLIHIYLINSIFFTN